LSAAHVLNGRLSSHDVWNFACVCLLVQWRYGTFVGTSSGTVRGMSCLLVKLRGKADAMGSLIAGGVYFLCAVGALLTHSLTHSLTH
jgi:hypothetical protein